MGRSRSSSGCGSSGLAWVDGHALALSGFLEHALERVLATKTALLVAAIWLPDDLPEALIDLHEAGVDRVRGADRLGDVAAPHVRGEPEVRVVRHADHLSLVGPRDRDEHRPEDLL